MRHIVVVDNLKDFNLSMPDVELISAETYISDPEYMHQRRLRICNLCRSYRYQGVGYYVSLLAEARSHHVIPSITTIQDFRSQTIIRIISDDLDQRIQRDLAHLRSKAFTLSIYFGRNIAKRYDRLSRQLYNLFRAPLLRASFVYAKAKWSLQYISPIPLREIPDDHSLFLIESARSYFSSKSTRTTKPRRYRYDLAILVDPREKEPPSDSRAIQNFVSAAEALGMEAEIITADDYNRVSEFDALFIRVTTAVNHYTYRFARRAYADGLFVIDDPESIVRCCNKVYLAERFSRLGIPTPKTIVVNRDGVERIITTLGLPCILKQPDSSFSQGVIKVTDESRLDHELRKLMEKSDLICAQEFLPTPFDWRVGILDGKPLYVCKYHMAKGHWKIYNWEKKRRHVYGETDTVAIAETPKSILRTAIRAARSIGDGLYGVDLKQLDNKVYVIEVNDNPSIEAGLEDSMLKDELYVRIMTHFVASLDRLKGVNGDTETKPDKTASV